MKKTKSTKIDLYTVQSPEVYKILKRDGVVYPKLYKAECPEDECFEKAYGWMAKNMILKGLLSEGYPGMFWAHTKLKDVLSYADDGVVLKVTKDISEIFVTDYLTFHSVINGSPIVTTGVNFKHPEAGDLWDIEHDRLVKAGEVEKTWDIVKDVYIGKGGKVYVGPQMYKYLQQDYAPVSSICLQVTFANMKQSEVKRIK